jgi:hypothetical protein
MIREVALISAMMACAIHVHEHLTRIPRITD